MLQSQQNGMQHMHTKVRRTALTAPQQEIRGNACHPSPLYPHNGQHSAGVRARRFTKRERCHMGYTSWCRSGDGTTESSGSADDIRRNVNGSADKSDGSPDFCMVIVC
jgi:hypothetical protein